MTPEQELQDRKGVNDVPIPCRNCGHSGPFHIRWDLSRMIPCEYELGDSWVTGNQPSQPTVLMAMGPCGCTNYEPMEAGEILKGESDGDN